MFSDESKCCNHTVCKNEINNSLKYINLCGPIHFEIFTFLSFDPQKKKTHTHTHIYLYIHVCINEGESKSNAFFFGSEIITDTGTCIIHPNEAAPLWITFLFLDIVTFYLNKNVPLLIEIMCPCLLKFCWLLSEPLHHCSFYFRTTGSIFIISLFP